MSPEAVKKLAQKLDGQKNIAVEYSLIKEQTTFTRIALTTTEIGTYLDKLQVLEPDGQANEKKRA